MAKEEGAKEDEKAGSIESLNKEEESSSEDWSHQTGVVSEECYFEVWCLDWV